MTAGGGHDGARASSLRFLELQDELVDRCWIAEHDAGAGIFRMAQEVTLIDELEPSGLDL